MSEALSSPTISLPSRAYSRMKKVAWIGLAFFGLLVGTILIVPTFIDLGLFKSTYLPLVEDTLNRRVDVNEVRLRLLPTPSIRLSSLRVSDGPTSPDNTFFSAQQVRLQLKFLPLLRGRFEITEFILEKPVFNLAKQGDVGSASNANKRSSAGARRDPRKRVDASKGIESTPVPIIIPDRMTIRDGQLIIDGRGRVPIVIRGIDLSLQEFSVDHPFPFHASFEYPGLKTVSLRGELDYQEAKSLVQLKKNRLTIHNLDLPLQGSVSNLATTPRFNLNLIGDNVDAKPIFQILSVFGLAPRDTEVSGPMGLSIDLSGPANNLTTQVRGLFKDVKVHGKRALKGTLTGEVLIRLPLGGGAVTRRLDGSGKLTARDGELTNVDLIEKIQRVTGMIGLSKEQRREATTFQRMEASFILGGGYAEFTRLYLVNPQLEVTGDGTMTLEQPTLDMVISTALSPQASVRAGRGRTATFLKDDRGRVVVPLKVTGPVEKPSVNLNVGKLSETAIPRSVEKGFGSFIQQLFRNR